MPTLPSEKLTQFKVIQPFTATRFFSGTYQKDVKEEVLGSTTEVAKDEILHADPEAPYELNGVRMVRFFSQKKGEDPTYCVSKETFVRNTHQV